MKKKILAMLLVLCFVLGLGTLTAAAEEEHEHEFQRSCSYVWCWCGYVLQNGYSAHRWVFVPESNQHYKLCVNCWDEKDYENHGWYTSGGSTYCGSCGYTKP